ncbi:MULTISPECIES: helix-turn-helix domain-containing protein [unclassified Burkholderia]|uniref:helix-turn-helix domain-containing protein n=1 Tax=unclassified Burkholderia TaxID=2613784 RepID=UPI0009E90024|nr:MULTISPECIES: helix-turn-helix transcriptional regulator [unclassified Burkholderia]
MSNSDIFHVTLSRWEHGARAPTLHRLQQLSDALNCSVDQLLQRGSKRPDDQLAMIADALDGLDSDEREYARMEATSGPTRTI